MRTAKTLKVAEQKDGKKNRTLDDVVESHETALAKEISLLSHTIFYYLLLKASQLM